MSRIALVAEDQVLKVHRTHEGIIWYLDGGRMPVAAGTDMVAFSHCALVRDSPRVRLLGTRDNSPLIARIYSAKQHGGAPRSLEVASPLVGRTSAERDDPCLMLFRMRKHACPPSLGGWHEVDHLDYPSYLLAMLDRYQSAAVANGIATAFRAHPLAGYAAMIPHLDLAALAALVALIIDPRWFASWISPCDPGNPRDLIMADDHDLGRLRSFLGLDPRTMASAQSGGNWGHADRCRLVLATWKTSLPPPEALGDDPRYFLWRRWRKYDTEAKADLRTSQYFIGFLRLCWLDALSVARGRPAREGLFVPEFFFGADTAEARLFRAQRRMLLKSSVPDYR